MELLYIGFFGALGVVARYYLGILATRLFSHHFPYGTFVINLLGAFAIGILYTLSLERWSMSVELRTGLIVGLLGGFTTFSSYCLETMRLAEETQYQSALLYFGLSPLLGVASTFAGVFLTRKFLN